MKSVFKQIFQLLFRVIPYPTHARLMRFGNPNRNSPVLVTANYDLTVRRLSKALESVDCFLLVAPTKGVNVWCGAGGKHFSTESINSILKTSRIKDLVDHRKIILPQLSACGINGKELEEKTGWTPIFGPVYAKDIPEFLAKGNKKTREMNLVHFRVTERMEMGIAMGVSIALRYTIFPLLILGWHIAYWFVFSAILLSILMSVLMFKLPGKTSVQKGLTLCFISYLIFLSYSLLIGLIPMVVNIQWGIILILLGGLIGYVYPSYTPHWQCNYSKLFYNYPDIELKINQDKCSRCGLCYQVCPIGCFSEDSSSNNRKYIVSDKDKCMGCMACLKQCPGGVIINKIT